MKRIKGISYSNDLACRPSDILNTLSYHVALSKDYIGFQYTTLLRHAGTAIGAHALEKPQVVHLSSWDSGTYAILGRLLNSGLVKYENK